MTRPKNSTETYDRYPAFWAGKVGFSDDERATLEGICSDPGFIEALQDLAALYQGMKSIKTPTPGVVRDRLKEIATLATELRRRLGGIDYKTRDCLETTVGFELAESQNKGDLPTIERELIYLALAANEARKKYTDNKPSAMAGNSEASTATQLLTIFNRYGLPFSGYDFSDDHGKPGGPAAICLRLVLGKEKKARVGKWLRRAQKQREQIRSVQPPEEGDD